MLRRRTHCLEERQKPTLPPSLFLRLVSRELRRRNHRYLGSSKITRENIRESYKLTGQGDDILPAQPFFLFLKHVKVWFVRTGVWYPKPLLSGKGPGYSEPTVSGSSLF